MNQLQHTNTMKIGTNAQAGGYIGQPVGDYTKEARVTDADRFISDMVHTNEQLANAVARLSDRLSRVLAQQKASGALCEGPGRASYNSPMYCELEAQRAGIELSTDRLQAMLDMLEV